MRNEKRVAGGLGPARGDWQLPHRVGRDNSDAFDPLALDRSAFFAATRHGRGLTELAEHVVASDQSAEGGVLAVEKLRVSQADEKLAARRVRVLRAGHGNSAAAMRAFVELGLDRVAGAAGTPARFCLWIARQRVPALDHETLEDAVKGGPIVEAVFGEGLEIFDGFGRHVRPEAKDYVSVGGLDDGTFFGRGRTHRFTFGC